MDPITAAVFVVAWIARHAWDEKVDEFRADNKEVRKQINQRHPNASKDRREQMVRNAARRKAGGWNLYQLRHGWPSLWTALKDGYAEARRDHQEWQQANPKGNPKAEGKGEGKTGKKKRFRLVEAARSGWKRATEFTMAKRARRQEAEQQAMPPKTPQPVPSAPQGAKAAAAAPTKVIPINTPRPASKAATSTPNRNNGGTTPMASNTATGEVGGFAGSQDLTNEYIASLGKAQSVLEQYEASLLAGGLAKDPAVMGTLASMREGLNSAQTAAQAHRQGLNTHEQGAEYASSKGSAAAKTEWLGNN